MKRYRRCVHGAAVVVLASGLLSMAGVAPRAAAASVISVDPGEAYQTFEGWGTSLAWFANILGGASATVRTRVANLLFNPKTGLGLTVVRYNIGGGENPKYDFMQLRAQMPGFEPRPGVWNWHADANQRWFLQAAISRGANEVQAFSNSPPYWMTVSGSVTGSVTGATNNLKQSDDRAFATYLADVAQHFANYWHVTFRTVEPFNEPVSDWWKFGGSQEGSHFSNSLQNVIIQDVGQALLRRHLLSTVAAPDDNSIDQTVTSIESYSPQALANLSGIDTHGYTGTALQTLHTLSQHLGKDLWMSEYGDGDATGLTMSQQIVQDMQVMQPTAWVYWQAVDMPGSGWGFLNSPLNTPGDDTFSFNEKYFVMGQYSKFIRPGYQIIHVADNQTLGAYDTGTRTLVLVTTNASFAPRTLQFSFADFSSVPRTASVWQTTRDGVSESLSQLAPIVVRDRLLTATVPPASVTTFVLRGANYTPIRTRVMPWHVVLSKEGTQSTLHFSGTRAWLYGETGPNHGIMSVSVDGGPFVDVDTYSSQSVADGFLFSTPSLSSGQHTITVRESGRTDYGATGDQISLSSLRVQP